MSQEVTISSTDIGTDGVVVKGFTLETDKSILIEAVGAGGDRKIRRARNMDVDPENLFAYAWILDARSRELKWRMTVNNTESDWWDKHNRLFKREINLPSGEYELYFSAFKPKLHFGEGFLGPWDLMKKIIGGDDWWEDNSEKWKVMITGVDDELTDAEVLKYQRALKENAVVNFTQMGDDERHKQGFTLKQAANFKLYALGEGYKREMYDYAYIINANTRERIWEMEMRETDHAGGAFKNRMVSTEIHLEPDDYIVYYRSDPNHSYESWNANPPYDPNFWGLLLSSKDKNFDKSMITDYEEGEGKLYIKLNRLGDDEKVQDGFTCLKPTKIRIYALGEGDEDEMYDYGWIEDVQTGKTVWRMDYEETEWAGGAEKNRLYEGILTLQPGSYLVHYVTDGSHSYRGWNSRRSRPNDPEGWGIQIFILGKDIDINQVKSYDPKSDKNILVELIRVKNDEHVRKQFRLERSTEVRVCAIGEGFGDEMFDYAWIEDFDTGRIVWRMEFEETHRAGGHPKNRIFDHPIYLEAGTYIAHYRADDSHAYGSWNVKAPRDMAGWGIKIFKIDNR
jgi:hypothetical protein